MEKQDAVETSLARLAGAFERLVDRLDDRPKDGWAKLEAIAPIISGVMVGCIGLYATIVYDARQKEAESARKDRELVVTQVQTLEKFIPHLSSGDERRKEVAILGMAALGNQELAEKVALLYQGSGSAKALATFARSKDTTIAERSKQALASLGTSGDRLTAVAARSELATLLSELTENVVKVRAGQVTATGFVIRGNDAIVTVAHLFNNQQAPGDITITSPNGNEIKASLLKIDKDADVAVLRLGTKTDAQGIGFTAAPRSGTAVVILGSTVSGWKSTSGVITDTNAELEMFSGRQLLAKLDSAAGFSGAPVVDYDGRLIGMLHASNRRGTSILVPAARIVSVVESAFDGPNRRLQLSRTKPDG